MYKGFHDTLVEFQRGTGCINLLEIKYFFPSYFVFQARCYSGDQRQNVLRLDEPSIAAEIWVIFCSGKNRSVCIFAGKEEK